MPGIDECLLEAMTLPGARGAAVVDWTSGLALGTIGDAPHDDHEAAAADTAELARLAAEHTTFASPGASPPAAVSGAPAAAERGGGSGRGGRDSGGGGAGELSGAPAGAPVPVEDVIVTTRGGYHMLCFVETAFDSSVFVHLWLDRTEGNLALARIRLQDLTARLVLV